jgi:hypothetical protein
MNVDPAFLLTFRKVRVILEGAFICAIFEQIVHHSHHFDNYEVHQKGWSKVPPNYPSYFKH